MNFRSVVLPGKELHRTFACTKSLDPKGLLIHFSTPCTSCTGIPSDLQRLLYQGKQLVDCQTLQHYGISAGAELQLLFRLLGGQIPVVRFADVSDSRNLRKQAWAREAPSWRIARPGLCVEGHCRNPACAAAGRMIICNKAMGVFDLVVDAPFVYCPSCDRHVEPETCAFNNCEWRFTGIKTVDTPVMVNSLGWTAAGDQYERFSSDAACTVDWDRLLITTRPAPKQQQQQEVIAECAICLADVAGSKSDPEMTTRCGHRYHISCIEAWVKMGKNSCPMCQRGL